MTKEKQEKNIALLLFLSDYKDSSEEAVYHFVNDNKEELKYEGAQTNDAPVKCLLDMASEKLKSGAKLYILCITSNKVKNELLKRDNPDENTMWNCFQRQCTNYLVEDLKCEPNLFEFFSIPYDYDEYSNAKLSETTDQMAQRIFGEISDKLEKNSISDVYVDYTGGLRDINFLMTTIIRYLEFEGINCQKVVYSQYDKFNPDHNEIHDITYIYEMFQMINGVNEFVTTGNATALNEIFKSDADKIGDKEERTEYKEVKKLLKNIVDFANAMSICDVSNIDTYLENIRESINVLVSPDPEYKKKGDNQNLKVAMLKQLLPLMKEKMYLDDLGKKDYYIKLINWCVGNSMLQQALTLIEDKMPGVYFAMGLLTYEFKDNDNDNGSGEKEKFRNMDFVPGYETRDENIVFNYITRFRLPAKPRREWNSIQEELRNKKDNDINQINEKGDIESVLIELCGECQNERNQQDENKFIDLYCQFRKLEDKKENKKVGSNLSDFYTSDYYSILKWCVENENEYEYYKNRSLMGTVCMVLKMHRKLKNNQDAQADLEKTFLLHSALKKERNCCNHASEKGVRLPAEVVKRAIEIYVQRIEAVLKFIDGSAV